MAVEAGLSVYVVGGQGVRLFVVVVSCGVLDVIQPLFLVVLLSFYSISVSTTLYICVLLINN